MPKLLYPRNTFIVPPDLTLVSPNLRMISVFPKYKKKPFTFIPIYSKWDISIILGVPINCFVVQRDVG